MTTRQKLIWFALGALSSSAISVTAMIVLQSGGRHYRPTANYLIFQEPAFEAKAEDDFDRALIAYGTGKVLRDCGVRYFETTLGYDDHPPTADLPIIPQNLDALQCVLLRAEKEGISVRAETRWTGNGGAIAASLKDRHATASD